LTRSRATAGERREQLAAAAVTAFADGGYAGTTTYQVAQLAGVSQPYVQRLFGTKRELFLAALAHATDLLEQRFRHLMAGPPGDDSGPSVRCGTIADLELIRMLLHGFTAGADPDLGPAVRDCLGRIYRTVRALAGADEAEARSILAHGTLLALLGAMRIVGPDAVPREPWAAEILDGLRLRVLPHESAR